MGLRAVRSFVGAHARELMLLLSALRRRSSARTVVVIPSHDRSDPASNLRGYLIAEELQRSGWNAYVLHKNLDLRQRRRLIRVLHPDVILMQMARHPLNRPDQYDVPVVFDIDDADYIDDRQRANVNRALETSAAVIAGSRAVAEYCRKYNADVHIVWTGSPVSPGLLRPQADRPRVVSWAALYPYNCMAEADFLLEVMQSLVTRATDFQFLLYCDDGSAEFRAFSDRFRALGLNVITKPLIPNYAEFLETLDRVAVGLAPLVDIEGFSGGKSFGKVLSYIDRGVPIVTHPVVDHPLFFESGRNGFMAQSPDEWARIIAELLGNPAERQRVADAAREDLSRRLTTGEAAKRVDAVLRSAVERSRHPRS